MKVLWLTNIIMPEMAKALGMPIDSYGGWMSAQLDAIRKHNPSMQFYILTAFKKDYKIDIGRTTYGTFIGPRMASFPKGVPMQIENAVRAIVERFNPDVAHIHGTENYYARLSPETFCGAKTLVSLQGIINGYYPFYSGGVGPCEMRPFYNPARHIIKGEGVFIDQWKWQRYRARQEKTAFQSNAAFAGRTEWDLAWVKALNPDASYYHLDEIMRLPFYNKNRNKKEMREFSIYCSAAGSYPLKGLHWLLRAAALLVPRFPQITIRVADALDLATSPRGIMARMKEKEYISYLRSLIHELRLEKNVVALPRLSQEEVAEELARAHLFCLPSLCENSPNSLGEAMLMGLPCVATYVGGVPSMIQDREEGILCPPCDPVSLAAGIERLFLDEALASSLGESAKARALKQHDPERIARETVRIYRSILNESMATQ